MKKTNKEKVKEFIRVDHAGERGAVKIYEGQLLALNTFVKDENLKKKIEEMKIHEKEHCEYFENEIKKRNIKPTKFLPLWDLLGVGLGFGSTILGKKAAMLCTASVEEVIDEHYLDQINAIIIPKIVNHFTASVFINLLKISPNLYDRYETIKNLKPLENRQIMKNIGKLKPIMPLVIVNTLKGKGVKPARNKVASHT